ncbi:ATP-dependent Clp protease proteolytic subunit [Sphingopyxis sp. KK2]|uniref:ATP-dependent Clp protease proteolytic subunit n=1 Tax=Sphingopyxis sp. KK2 TaxID=1855727 RepID=UPI00097E6F4C|nr:ATP-dependent Clp protease proteolytic subunit [Sphingopyxis sp. KK2]
MADAEPAARTIDFDKPDVRLLGELDANAARLFFDTLDCVAPDKSPLIIDVTTPGGDAELGRRIALEVERLRKAGREPIFVGKSQCYSAGTTIMSAFPIRDRYLTRDCRLLIHSRQLDKCVQLAGPLRESLPLIEAVAAEIRVGAELEEEDFRRLIDGSKVSLEELLRKAASNWYLTAEEALTRGLIAEII